MVNSSLNKNVMYFKQFLAESEAEYREDIKKTLANIPKRHAALVAGYKFKFQNSNTLNQDKEHVGLIDAAKKQIVIASPWNYGRQYTLLHEIGHMVYDKFLDDANKETWKKIVKRTKDKQNQSAEELFCMAYANTYAKNQIVIHTHPEWERFVKTIR